MQEKPKTVLVIGGTIGDNKVRLVKALNEAMKPDAYKFERIPLEKVVKLDHPKGLNRVETGAIQFGDDWPGIFIRGDNAFHLSMLLDSAAKKCSDPIDSMQLKTFSELLNKCSQKNDSDTVYNQGLLSLREESAKLIHSLNKLEKFISADEFSTIPPEMQSALKKQQTAMFDYSICLIERIKFIEDNKQGEQNL